MLKLKEMLLDLHLDQQLFIEKLKYAHSINNGGPISIIPDEEEIWRGNYSNYYDCECKKEKARNEDE